MSEQGVDLGRRRFLTVATAVTGGVGVALVATPFMASMKPSARAQALGAAVDLDISKLESGALLKAEWRGQGVSSVTCSFYQSELPDEEIRVGSV